MSIALWTIKPIALVGLLALTLSACVLPAPPVAVKAPVALPAAVEPASAIPLYKNLGAHIRKVTISSPLAQQYFDQALTLTYAFNHAEAIKMFKEAARLDPACAMCYWGIAYALGPNINAPMGDAAVPDAFAALQKAHELVDVVSPVEQDLIAALASRYVKEPVKDRAPLDKAYADTMRVLAKKYPEDADVNTFFAESLMDLMPWNFWTKDGQPTTYTEEIITTLESVLKRALNHPGANHYYIHATEASFNPERALPSAMLLMTLVPDAGHLVHMPAHTFWRVGRYHDAMEMNQHAIHTDEGHNFTPDQGGGTTYSMGYYPHNIQFLYSAASMIGESTIALDAARKLDASIPLETFTAIPSFEGLPSSTLLAMVRFGKWDDILKFPQPPETLRYVNGIWHYARGMAFVRQNKLAEAEKELMPLKELAQSKAMQELGLANFATASQLLTIAWNTLEGELAGAQGNIDHQVEHLQQAVQVQDTLPYFEPPAWYAPTRQMLGAALLKGNRAAEAEAVYQADLKQYPQNGWSLLGLAQSLKAQGKDQEAAEAQKMFEAAWQFADVTLTSSRF